MESLNYFINKLWDSARRSPPFLISLLLHGALLMVCATVTWQTSAVQRADEYPGAAIVLEQPRNEELRFQGREMLDRRTAQETKLIPMPDIDEAPSLPDVKFVPDIKIREDLNLIGIDVMSRMRPSSTETQKTFYAGEERLRGSFTRHIQGLREAGLDIVFVFDATSSMAEFLRQVKFKISGMVETFKRLVPTSRIGLVAYRDRGDDFVTKSHPLTHGVNSLKDFLKEIDPVGGGDREEALDEALRVAIQELNWKRNSKKIILIIGDAPPHKSDLEKCNALINTFKSSMGGMVGALDTSAQTFKPAVPGGESGAVLEEFKQLAALGGGESARLVDEEKVIRQMVVLVFGSRWEVCLDEFLKNL